mmetsp:Transcript_26184/g.40979  ORF Transcript_26184/g.40979 Transcript_26184/m.40979 type:complete len:187 (+) Transcript_26184:625-1185(+)
MAQRSAVLAGEGTASFVAVDFTRSGTVPSVLPASEALSDCHGPMSFVYLQVCQETGAMEFVTGSHQWNKWFQPETFAPSASDPYEQNPRFLKMTDIESERDAHKIVSFDMQSGDVLAFHALVVHGSCGNQSSTKMRRGYVVRYTGDDAVYTTDIGSHKDLRNPLLKEGDKLDSEQYPVVYSGNYVT